MKLKKIGAVALAFLLVVGGNTYNTTYAMEVKEPKLISNNDFIITPFWTHISCIIPRISAKGTTLYPEVYVEAHSTSAVINGTMYLERNVSGWWTTVTSWNIKGTGDAFLSETYKGVSGSLYRIGVSVDINGEKVHVTSGTCTVK